MTCRALQLFPGFDWKEPDYGRVWAARTAKLQALRREPERWEALKRYYAESPTGATDFINDWACTFDPRNALPRPDGTKVPTTMPFLLFDKQQQCVEFVMQCLAKREPGLVEKSRDMGVSWLCVAISQYLWQFRPGSVTGFGSRKEDLVDKIGDPDSLFWKLRMLVALLPVELRPRGYDERKHAPFMRLINPETESVVVGEAGDNIGRGARATLYFKDESAHYEHPEDIDAALSQTANTTIDVSTPNGEGNPFWQKRHGGICPVFVFDWRDDPRKGPEWYATQKRNMTPTALAAEVDRDYSASISNSFIESRLVTEAMARGPFDVAAIGPLRIGLDVARFGDDKCVLTFRRGRVVIRVVKWRKSSIPATYGRAKQEILRYSKNGLPEQIAVDVIGLGAGVYDLLAEDRAFFDSDGETVCQEVNAALPMDNGEDYNLRAFMWRQMKDWLPTASLPNDPDFRVSLTGIRYGYRGGAMILESKDDMKKRGLKSPDEGDSLALTFAYPGKRKRSRPPPRDRVAVYGVTDDEMGM